MRRTELVNHIKGSYLKKQYLEAFLVQSAYIEGLLKIFADYKYWKDIIQNVSQENQIILELRKRIKRFGLNELIDFLFKITSIDDEQKKTLHKYKEKEIMLSMIWFARCPH
ncbi:MAG: hypothetical protein RLZZ347_439 [Candidatus Parcubacteria bacterium]|jgi:hypothetical protein